MQQRELHLEQQASAEMRGSICDTHAEGSPQRVLRQGQTDSGRSGMQGINQNGECRVAKQIEFVVPGKPVGKGRHRSAVVMRNGKPVIGKGGRPIMTQYSSEKTVNFEGLVAHAAFIAMSGQEMFQGPVHVDLDIRMPIPVSWSKKRREMAEKGLIAPTVKPDVDNVTKAVIDGMNGVVWNDDVQVVGGYTQKRYATTPGVLVIVREKTGVARA